MKATLRFQPSGAWPAVIVAVAAGAWGLYWLPLRALHQAGVPVAWVPALLYAIPCLVLAVAAIVRERSRFTVRSALTGLLAGCALAFYTDALLLTEVIRALIFFYLTPVWSTIFESVFLGKRISAVRIASICIGFSGIGIVVGAGSDAFLVGFNIGDALALVSGIAWAWATVRIYSVRGEGVAVLSAWFLGFGAMAGIALALAGVGKGEMVVVDWDRIVRLVPWFVAFGLLVVIPSVMAMMWGAAILAPGLLGILLMTEISVGTVSAALWAGEPIGVRELAGIALVTLAGVLEAGFSAVSQRRIRG